MLKEKRIYLHNALQVQTFLEIWDEGDRDFVAYEGPATVVFSSEPNGAAIGALSSPMTVTPEPGVYTAHFAAADIDQDLASKVGEAVYQIVTAGPADELKIVTTLLVTDGRFVP